MAESIWRRFKRIWSDPKAAQEDKAPADAMAEFDLLYGTQRIGTLRLAHSVWSFEYSDEFRHGGHLRTITEFPDVEKLYVSDQLWPFFLTRIPSLRQASIKKAVAKEHIDERDEAELLRRFGRRVVANPYELIPRFGESPLSATSLAR